MLKSSSALALGGAVILLALTTAACGNDSSTATTGHGGMSMSTPTASASSSATGHMSGMPGMDDDMPTTDGLSASASGYSLAISKNSPAAVTFTIDDSKGTPVTAYEPDQTKLMHFYVVRSDLTGFQHIHPTMAPGGTWTAPVKPLQPGTWRVYASFIPKGTSTPLVLGDELTISGKATTTALPPATTRTTVDGYTLSLSGEPMAGMAHPTEITITKDGRPVTDLEPYLGTSAHVTAIHEGDMAFAHLHPHGATGSRLSFEAMFPDAGNWRLFIQFQTSGTLHTAAMTVAVR